MWKKYKFEWKFLSSAVAGVIQQTGGKSIKLSDFLGVARTTPAGKRRRKKAEIERIISYSMTQNFYARR